MSESLCFLSLTSVGCAQNHPWQSRSSQFSSYPERRKLTVINLVRCRLKELPDITKKNSQESFFDNLREFVPPKSPERKTFFFQKIMREIRNFSKAIISESFSVTNNFVSEGISLLSLSLSLSLSRALSLSIYIYIYIYIYLSLFLSLFFLLSLSLSISLFRPALPCRSTFPFRLSLLHISPLHSPLLAPLSLPTL